MSRWLAGRKEEHLFVGVLSLIDLLVVNEWAVWILKACVSDIKVVMNAINSSKFFFFKRLESDSINHDWGLTSPRTGVRVVVGSHRLDVIPEGGFCVLGVCNIHL